MRGERATMGKSLLDVQRDLKIKATYIAAIENADVSAFETPGFIAGYVRSYARYLGMDPDESFARFCAEANFTLAHGMSAAASSPASALARERRASPGRDPFADPATAFVPRRESVLARVEPGAIGSVAVLVALISALGYGGWSVLQEVQRVQLAPVDQAPQVVADIDPLGNVPGAPPLVRSAPEGGADAVVGATPAGLAQGASPSGIDRLYRPEALDLPVMVSRDGPIAAIDPRREVDAIAAAVDEALTAEDTAQAPVQVLAAAAPGVELLAVRPSWVRVQSADGTVLFEKILDAGERYAVPVMEQPPLLRAGNSGSLYFSVNGQAYGPAAPGAQVVRNVVLSPEALTEAYALADLSRDADLSRYVTTVAEAAAD
ncbi:MAG: DUF4115 domain-containing protein [Paracoccaceae bacterium]|nr:MAG: DUF4115 domain-containing protein [Paracoccaceae bacterium]